VALDEPVPAAPVREPAARLSLDRVRVQGIEQGPSPLGDAVEQRNLVDHQVGEHAHELLGALRPAVAEVEQILQGLGRGPGHVQRRELLDRLDPHLLTELLLALLQLDQALGAGVEHLPQARGEPLELDVGCGRGGLGQQLLGQRAQRPGRSSLGRPGRGGTRLAALELATHELLGRLAQVGRKLVHARA